MLGQCIRVYTDHKNVTYKTFNTNRVLRWRLILEEFSPKLIYIKGQNNVIADALSRLDETPDSLNKPNADSLPKPHMTHLAESYVLDNDDLPEDAFPIIYSNILKH